MDKMRVAIIPARGGSQRIPHKNIKPMLGKPLIGYSIETAIQTNLFDRIIVSTDCNATAAIAREFGAETPYIRPDDLSDNLTGTTPVMQHAVSWLKQEGYPLQEACLIYATCPLLKAEYLIEGLKRLQTHRFSFAATTFPFPIQRALRKTDSGVQPMFPQWIYERSQDLEEAIHDAGQFYWGMGNDWISKPDMFGADSSPVMIPRHLVQDLDTKEDWEVLERLLKVRKLNIDLA